MLPSHSGGHAGVVRMICGHNNLINVVAHTEETDKEIHELELIADAWIVAAFGGASTGAPRSASLQFKELQATTTAVAQLR